MSNSNGYVWEKLRFHPVQAQLWGYTGRFCAIVAGRRSGKTELCKRKLILQLPIKKPWPNPNYLYVLPTFAQAKRVAWKDFLRMIPKAWIVPKSGINVQDMSITTIFGSTLYVVGADKPARMEGIGADWAMVDESSDQRPGLFEQTISPMLADREGCCYRLGVPKRHGIGRIDFREYFNRGLRNESGIASFHWKSAEVISEKEIAIQRSQLDEQTFAEQFEAMWQDVGGSVYYAFSEENIRDDSMVCYQPDQEIAVGCDFNVDPMCWTLSHYMNGKLYTFDEIFLRNTNTQKTLDFLYNKYYQHDAGWRFFGDATSHARKTSSVISDYFIIKNDARFGEKKIFFPEKNPHVRDRFAAVNAAFKNASGDIRLYVNAKCKHLINDFNSVAYVEGTTEPEDYSGTDIGHMSDAHGYAVKALMPIIYESNSAPSIYAA
jgi:hypothetical protein